MSRKITTFIDIQRGKSKLGRIKIELWDDKLPRTCENFRQLCTGEYVKNNAPQGFKDSCFYEIGENFLRAGDYNLNNGKGGESIFEEKFLEVSKEVFKVEEGSAWIVSMITDEEKKFTSLFQFTKIWIKHQSSNLFPFAQVLDENSIKVLNEMIETPSQDLKPKNPIVIVECGEM